MDQLIEQELILFNSKVLDSPIGDYYITFSQFTQQFKFVRKSKILGMDNYQINIRKDIKNGHLINSFKQTISIQNLEQLDEIINLIQSLAELNQCESIVPFLKFSFFCQKNEITIFYIYAYFDYCVEDFLQKTLELMKPVQLTKLSWKLAGSILGVASYLQQFQNLYPKLNNISSRNIFYTDLKFQQFYIFYSPLMASELECIQQYNNSITKFFLSPEQLKILNQQKYQNTISETYDTYKSLIFSIGLLLVECLNNKFTSSIYSIGELLYNEDILDNKINYILENYSKKIQYLIAEFLKYDHQKRLDIYDAIMYLEKLKISSEPVANPSIALIRLTIPEKFYQNDSKFIEQNQNAQQNFNMEQDLTQLNQAQQNKDSIQSINLSQNKQFSFNPKNNFIRENDSLEKYTGNQVQQQENSQQNEKNQNKYINSEVQQQQLQGSIIHPEEQYIKQQQEQEKNQQRNSLKDILKKHNLDIDFDLKSQLKKLENFQSTDQSQTDNYSQTQANNSSQKGQGQASIKSYPNNFNSFITNPSFINQNYDFNLNKQQNFKSVVENQYSVGQKQQNSNNFQLEKIQNVLLNINTDSKLPEEFQNQQNNSNVGNNFDNILFSQQKNNLEKQNFQIQNKQQMHFKNQFNSNEKQLFPNYQNQLRNSDYKQNNENFSHSAEQTVQIPHVYQNDDQRIQKEKELKQPINFAQNDSQIKQNIINCDQNQNQHQNISLNTQIQTSISNQIAESNKNQNQDSPKYNNINKISKEQPFFLSPTKQSNQGNTFNLQYNSNITMVNNSSASKMSFNPVKNQNTEEQPINSIQNYTLSPEFKNILQSGQKNKQNQQSQTSLIQQQDKSSQTGNESFERKSLHKPQHLEHFNNQFKNLITQEHSLYSRSCSPKQMKDLAGNQPFEYYKKMEDIEERDDTFYSQQKDLKQSLKQQNKNEQNSGYIKSSDLSKDLIQLPNQQQYENQQINNINDNKYQQSQQNLIPNTNQQQQQYQLNQFSNSQNSSSNKYNNSPSKRFKPGIKVTSSQNFNDNNLRSSLLKKDDYNVNSPQLKTKIIGSNLKNGLKNNNQILQVSPSQENINTIKQNNTVQQHLKTEPQQKLDYSNNNYDPMKNQILNYVTRSQSPIYKTPYINRFKLLDQFRNNINKSTSLLTLDKRNTQYSNYQSFQNQCTVLNSNYKPQNKDIILKESLKNSTFIKNTGSFQNKATQKNNTQNKSININSSNDNLEKNHVLNISIKIPQRTKETDQKSKNVEKAKIRSITNISQNGKSIPRTSINLINQDNYYFPSYKNQTNYKNNSFLNNQNNSFESSVGVIKNGSFNNPSFSKNQINNLLLKSEEANKYGDRKINPAQINQLPSQKKNINTIQKPNTSILNQDNYYQYRQEYKQDPNLSLSYSDSPKIQKLNQQKSIHKLKNQIIQQKDYQLKECTSVKDIQAQENLNKNYYLKNDNPQDQSQNFTDRTEKQEYSTENLQDIQQTTKQKTVSYNRYNQQLNETDKTIRNHDKDQTPQISIDIQQPNKSLQNYHIEDKFNPLKPRSSIIDNQNSILVAVVENNNQFLRKVPEIDRKKLLIDCENEIIFQQNLKGEENTYNMCKELKNQKQKQLKKGIQIIKYDDGSVYKGQICKNQREGLGIFYFNSEEVYAGQWKDDQFHGQGTYFFPNGDIYIGQLKKGYKHGNGQYFYNNGNYYKGKFQGNVKQGFGLMIYNNNEVYEGNWKKNTKFGEGTYYFQSGDKFIGRFFKGEKLGHGKLYFKDGSQFNGFWKNDKANGRGILKYQNGDFYEGEFKDGKKKGYGMLCVDGKKLIYTGQWDEDTMSGTGCCQYENGDKYIGQFIEGFRDGQGVYYYKNGSQYEGDWKKNLKQGKGVFKFQDQETMYEGEFSEDQRNGFGIIQFPNGEKYEGHWKNDYRNGQGTYYFSDKSVYQGEWKNDKMHGKGVLINNQMDKFSGVWENNNIVHIDYNYCC